MKIKHLLLLVSILSSIIIPQQYQILESNNSHITIKLNFNNYEIKDTTISGRLFSYVKTDNFSARNPGEPWLPLISLNLGIPSESN
ncbi:MAG: hypothetical protein ACK4R9_06935, partial [Ignavibacterium sp.]